MRPEDYFDYKYRREKQVDYGMAFTILILILIYLIASIF